MFNWFWEFLYSISEILFLIIDSIFKIANKLCGIEPIIVEGQETDLLTYLLNHQNVRIAFWGAVLIGLFLLAIFSIIAIFKSASDGKRTTGQIAMHAAKTLLIFFAIPGLMAGFTIVLNQLMLFLFQIPRVGYNSIGEFLCRSFMPTDIQTAPGTLDFNSVKSVKAFMSSYGYSLKNYQFFFSWIICLPLLIILAISLLHFVDRTLSIVLLYIISPIVLSTTVVDDGEHFKYWRDMILAKYLTGYGIILALNIYVLVLSAITNPAVKFFDTGILNFLLKMAFAIGGGIFLMKMTALVGNLVRPGQGDADFQSTMMASGKIGSGIWAVATTGVGALLPKKVKKDAKNALAANPTTAAAAGMIDTGDDGEVNEESGKTNSANHNSAASLMKTENKSKEAIEGPAPLSNNGSNNNNHEQNVNVNVRRPSNENHKQPRKKNRLLESLIDDYEPVE